MNKQRTWIGWSLALLVLLAVPALAESRGDVVPNGIDVWKTVDGMTHTTFAKDPVPADFFCKGSQPFTGRLKLRGARLAAEPAANLGDHDTIVRRLDDARFDENGEAKTRIQLLALNLVSMEPIETECGRYDVAVSLDGEQPTTEMKIVRTIPQGGYFVAPLALNIKIAFSPAAGNSNPRRVLSRQIALGNGSQSVWSATSSPKYAGAAKVDTDGDGRPDSQVPAPAKGFVTGVAPFANRGDVLDGTPICPYTTCHCAAVSDDPWEDATGCEEDHLHCQTVYLSPTVAAQHGVLCYISAEGPPAPPLPPGP